MRSHEVALAELNNLSSSRVSVSLLFTSFQCILSGTHISIWIIVSGEDFVNYLFG